MKKIIEEYFKTKNVEYYSVIPYEKCREINGSIIARENFEPRSVIMFLLPYYTGEAVNISRYASSLDYHIIIREIADGLAEVLRIHFPTASLHGYGDHSPIDEVNAALISGLGVIGDNGLIINEKYGTYVFIGDLVTDIPADELGATPLGEISGCMHCEACKGACPTRILSGEGSDCLSAITQRKGDLTEDEADLMRKYNTAWGCDMCQSACPYNKDPVKTPIEFFYRERINMLTRELLDSMDKETFRLRAFAWRGRRTVERNLDILGD